MATITTSGSTLTIRRILFLQTTAAWRLLLTAAEHGRMKIFPPASFIMLTSTTIFLITPMADSRTGAPFASLHGHTAHRLALKTGMCRPAAKQVILCPIPMMLPSLMAANMTAYFPCMIKRMSNTNMFLYFRLLMMVMDRV